MIAAHASPREPYDIDDAKCFVYLALQAACDIGAEEGMIDTLMDVLREIETLATPDNLRRP